MKILIVEDMDSRNIWFRQNLIGRNLTFSYTFEQAKKALQEDVYDLIFLDHDLCEEHYVAMHSPVNVELVGTGADVAKLIAEHSYSPEAQIIIHSLNPAGSENMYRILKSVKRTVQKIPFTELQKRLKIY